MSAKQTDIYPIETQWRNLLYDKLVVCKKEISHLETVVRFFEYKQDNDPIYSKEFNYILANIDQLKTSIDKLGQGIDKLFSQANLHFVVLLTKVGRHEQQIYRFIRKIGLMQRKAAQINEDIFEQYIPKPALQRRHSNKVLSAFINNYFSDIYNIYKDENSEKGAPIFVWGHRDQFRVYNSLFEQNAKSHDIIENAFWYHEIPRLLPALAHEVGHLLSNTQNFKKFSNMIQKQDDGYSALFLQEKLTEEFFGDFIAYNELGDAYLITLFYTLLPTRFYNIFYDKQKNEISFDVPDENDENWRHLAIIIARLKILLDLHEVANNETGNDTALEKHIFKIKDFISKIAEYNEKEEDFNTLGYHYQAHDTLKDGYAQYVELIDIYYSAFRNCINNAPKTNKTKETIKYEDIFLNIWQKHIRENTAWYHPKILREEILRQILNNKNDAKEDQTFVPFELTFVKERTDEEQKQDQKWEPKEVFYENQNNDHSIDLNTYGIFNRAYIARKKESLGYDEILNFLQNNNKVDTIKGGYYLYKVPIVLIKEINGDNNTKGSFSLLLQLMLDPVKSAESDTIVQTCNAIINKLELEYELNVKNYKLFKTLGPSDFLVYIPNLTLSKLYQIKKAFWQIKDFKRTYSVICHDHNFQKGDSIDTKKYITYSKIRLKASTTSFDGLKDDSIISAIITTGVTDLEVRWKNIISPQKAYDSLKDKKIEFSDIQTFIAKNIEVKADEKNND